MDSSLFRYEDSYGRPRRKSNLFGWTIAILLLIGLAFAAWLGSFYIFGQPERPDSYRILKKLHKIDPPKSVRTHGRARGRISDRETTL